MKKQLSIGYRIIYRESAAPEVQNLLNEAEQAILNSHAPYSGFHVGAALLLSDGRIIRGSNQENAAFPIGYCAERTALSARISLAPDQQITAIGIAVLNKAGNELPPVAPCGLCRQALLEEELRQGRPILVWLAGTDGTVIELDDVSSLLPFRFDQSVFLPG